MKNKTLYRTLALMTVAAAATWLLAGCGTTKGYKQADKTGEGIADFREEILNGKKAVDDTMTSLDAIAATAATDPREAYEKFSKSMANLQSTADKVKKRGQAMQEQGQAYFTQWEQQLAQVKNPDIQKLAAERKAKLKEAFENIKNVTEPLKNQFEPWMSDLKDLQTYLSNDLTITGVDSAKSLFAKTHTTGLEVQKSLDAVIAELNSISAAITAAKATPGAQPTTEKTAAK